MEILWSVYEGIPWEAVAFALIFTWLDLIIMLGIAVYQRNLRSNLWKQGVKDKLIISSLVAYGIVLKAFFVIVEIPGDTLAIAGVANVSDLPICLWVCCLVCLMEVYSTLENFAKVNPVAARLLNLFNNNKEDEDENNHGKHAKRDGERRGQHDK